MNKETVEMIYRILNVQYNPESLGSELKRKGNFVKIVSRLIDDGLTETQIMDLLTARQ
jgi:hypothetical protein